MRIDQAVELRSQLNARPSHGDCTDGEHAVGAMVERGQFGVENYVVQRIDGGIFGERGFVVFLRVRCALEPT
jgi:hypothetical protein